MKPISTYAAAVVTRVRQSIQSSQAFVKLEY